MSFTYLEPYFAVSEQIGVDIMNNLQRDREVIERARERVSPQIFQGFNFCLMCNLPLCYASWLYNQPVTACNIIGTVYIYTKRASQASDFTVLQM